MVGSRRVEVVQNPYLERHTGRRAGLIPTKRRAAPVPAKAARASSSTTLLDCSVSSRPRAAQTTAGQSEEYVIEVRPGGRRRIDRVLSDDFTQGITEWPLEEVRHARDEADQEETDLSYLRRMLHARIDIVLAEQQRREQGEEPSVVEQLVSILSSNVLSTESSSASALGGPTGRGRHQTHEPSRAEAHRRRVEALISDVDLSNVLSLTENQLEEALAAYRQQEDSVSQRRREVQAVVDQLNSEIARRYREGSASVDELLASQKD